MKFALLLDLLGQPVYTDNTEILHVKSMGENSIVLGSIRLLVKS